MNQINVKAGTGSPLKASQQWMRRPADERFLNLIDLRDHCRSIAENSLSAVVSSRSITFAPTEGDPIRGLCVQGHNGRPHSMTHHAFNQACSLVKAPARYLRTLPSPMVADLLTYGTQHARSVEDVGVLLDKRDPDAPLMRAITGPNYGRVWDAQVADTLVEQFGRGDGTDGGRWRVPGVFGRETPITKRSTTLYAGDEDVFVFLADERNKVEVPNRRNGQPGTMSRGIMLWNSEVGGGSLGGAWFLYDWTCENRIIWGMGEYHELRIRHTSGAPDRWVEEMIPLLEEFAEAPAVPITDTIMAAQKKKLAKDEEDVLAFCRNRFGQRVGDLMQALHLEEEERPIETVWDAVTAATAVARDIPWQNQRAALEREAGRLLDKVAA